MSLPGRNTNRGAASNSDLPDKAVREHVAHICQTKGFLKSERLKRFLSYTVERLLANDTDTLKEYAIALEVFDRSAAYNPKIDAVVRVEARRLRLRLEQYYATDGLHEPIRIHFPNGSYIPVVTRLKQEPANAGSRSAGRGNMRGRWWLGAGCLAVAATTIFGVRAVLQRMVPRFGFRECLVVGREPAACVHGRPRKLTRGATRSAHSKSTKKNRIRQNPKS